MKESEEGSHFLVVSANYPLADFPRLIIDNKDCSRCGRG